MAYQANRGNSNSDSKRAAQDQKNAEMVKAAADVAQHSANPYAKAAGTAVKVGDKLTGGKVSQKLGTAMRNSPAEKLMGLNGPLNGNDSRLKEMFQRNNLRKNTGNLEQNSSEKEKDTGGEQKGSPSSGSKKEDSKDKKDEKSGKEDEGKKEGSERKPSDLLPKFGDKDGPLSEIKAKIKRIKIIIIAAGILSGFLIIITAVIAVVSAVLNLVSGFDDALGISVGTGKSTGNIAYNPTSQEQREFYERVNDVELDFLANGQQIDSLKVVAVYQIGRAHV